MLYVSCHIYHFYIFFSILEELSHLESLATGHKFKTNVEEGRRGDVRGERVGMTKARRETKAERTDCGQMMDQ